MKIIKIKGGLGNQLFQYAFARYLSTKYKLEVKIDNGVGRNKQDTYRKYQLDKYNIVLPLATVAEVEKILDGQNFVCKIIKLLYQKLFNQYNIGYSKINLKKEDQYLEGYWQSHLYLDPIREELLQEVTLKREISESTRFWLDDIKTTKSVSVHIRRGDYVSDAKTKKVHDVCGLEYFFQAIKAVKDKVSDMTLYVFSDDIDWAKENLANFDSIKFVKNSQISDQEELFLMSNCKHNIISNSTFSFWGAWLNQNNDKIVIAPSRWNNKYQKDYKDLLPEEWIKIKI